jgi:hypothetical protein
MRDLGAVLDHEGPLPLALRLACEGALFSPARFPLSYGAFNTFGLAGKNLLSGAAKGRWTRYIRCAAHFHRDKGGSHGRVS